MGEFLLPSHTLDFPGGSDGKASAYNAGRPGFNPWVGKVSWRRKWQSTPIFTTGKFHTEEPGRLQFMGSWVYSPRVRYDWATNTHTHLIIPTQHLVFSWAITLPMEKAMAPNSSTLAWKIPRTEEPGRLQSMGSRRVRHDWATSLSLFTFTFHFHALEKEMATHSSVLAWRIPGTGEPGGLPSLGSHRIRHDWSDLAAAAAVILFNVGAIFKSFCFDFLCLQVSLPSSKPILFKDFPISVWNQRVWGLENYKNHHP